MGFFRHEVDNGEASKVRFISNSLRLLMAGVVASFLLPFHKAEAGANPFLGEIGVFGANFCPRGWAAANGQLLAISQYEALFSLLGTMYGGDGRTTFALPDLRGRTAIGRGKGPGLEERAQGQTNEPEVIQYAPGATKAAADAPYLVLNYCIAFQGTYPSRN